MFAMHKNIHEMKYPRYRIIGNIAAAKKHSEAEIIIKLLGIMPQREMSTSLSRLLQDEIILGLFSDYHRICNEGN